MQFFGLDFILLRKMNFVKKIWILILISMLFCSCKALKYNNIKNGDLVFVTAQKENLSGAINRVTQKNATDNYDHIGIIEKNKNAIFVLHAAAKGGSQKESLKNFIKNQSEGNAEIYLYRLKSEFQYSIPEAIKKANSLLGKPYNFNYIFNDETLYCSDFIERIFRNNHIFELKPMTFINPKTGKTDDFWLKFYQEKNLEVPEGKMGCNPNGLAGSEKLLIIRKLN